METFESRAKYLFTLFDVPSDIDYYLDVGAGHCDDALVFGKEAKQVLALDQHFWNISTNLDTKRKKLTMIKADARKLPFKTGVFQMISLLSVLEHIPEKRDTLSEVFRVLDKHGVILIQIPNRYFPIELHSGLPMINYIPNEVVRKKLLKMVGADDWFLTVDIPSFKGLVRLIKQANPQAHIVSAEKIVFPTNMLLPTVRKVSVLLSKIGFFNIFPYGYCITVTVQRTSLNFPEKKINNVARAPPSRKFQAIRISLIKLVNVGTIELSNRKTRNIIDC